MTLDMRQRRQWSLTDYCLLTAWTFRQTPWVKQMELVLGDQGSSYGSQNKALERKWEREPWRSAMQPTSQTLSRGNQHRHMGKPLGGPSERARGNSAQHPTGLQPGRLGNFSYRWEINPHVCDQLTYNEAKNIQWGQCVNKSCWENWTATWKRMKLNCYLILYPKINSKCIKDLKQ